jgi:hypothetical protein
VEIAGLFDPGIEQGLSSAERTLMSSLLMSAEMAVTIPRDVSPSDLWGALDICCRVFMLTRQAAAQLKLLIGRALILIQEDHPEIYQSRGYATFDSFMTEGLPRLTNMSRGELYKAKMVAESMGDVKPEDARAMGFSKMGILAKVTDDKKSDFPQWVERAKSMTIPELKIAIAESNLKITVGDQEEAVWSMVCTDDERARIDAFMQDPEVHAHCGTEKPGAIMDNLIAEADASGWRNQPDEEE